MITSLAAALFASPSFTAGVAAPATSTSMSVPPMIVLVSSASNVSASLVSRVLAETDAVWRSSGLTFLWRRLPREVIPLQWTGRAAPSLPPTLRVVIGNETQPLHDGSRPLGWIKFDNMTPEQEIYLSYAAVGQLMASAREVIGFVERMPLIQREILSARAMGRALAHELGHYLLASKIHTKGGLMKASWSSGELFATEPRGFQLDPSQWQVIAARLRRESLVVSR